MSDGNGRERLFDLFEKLRSKPAGRNASYETDDVIAVLYLLSRDYNVAEIERRTFITRERINKWKHAFLAGMIEDLYPDILERAAVFDVSLLPPERRARARTRLAWQQAQTRLEDRPNPYSSSNGKGNGHTAN